MSATTPSRLEQGEIEERLQSTLQLFGYERLSDEQDQLIRASIAGQDVLGVLPTGGGKSACYQIPGIVTRARTLVISPLIALQDDQVQALRKLGIKAFALHSGLPEPKKQAVHFYFHNAPRDEPSFLYMSPELLLTAAFHNRFDGIGFDRLAVDEAHCVSTWGDAFRPDYQRIRVATQRLRIPHCSAFTATVDPKIGRDIRRRIPLRSGFLTVEGDPMRPNLRLVVRYPASVEHSNVIMGRLKFQALLRRLVDEEYAGPAVIYCRSRDTATSLFLRLQKNWWFLNEKGYSVYLFHAGLPYEDKEAALYGFKNQPRPIVIATSAFGMGIDRADVRQIIHYQVPNTLIDYAQQIGRAGRDGKPARCTTFHLAGDQFESQTEKARWNAPTYDFVEQVHGWLRKRYAKLTHEEHKTYNVRQFLSHVRHIVEASEKIRFKDSYLVRVSTVVAMLQRSGIIREDGDGLSVFSILPGTKEHATLLELTQMHERMLVREQKRLAVFFGYPNPDQLRLWDILRRDEDLEPIKEESVEQEAVE